LGEVIIDAAGTDFGDVGLPRAARSENTYSDIGLINVKKRTNFVQ
jgi:hypothetical protein